MSHFSLLLLLSASSSSRAIRTQAYRSSALLHNTLNLPSWATLSCKCLVTTQNSFDNHQHIQPHGFPSRVYSIFRTERLLPQPHDGTQHSLLVRGPPSSARIFDPYYPPYGLFFSAHTPPYHLGANRQLIACPCGPILFQEPLQFELSFILVPGCCVHHSATTFTYAARFSPRQSCQQARTT